MIAGDGTPADQAFAARVFAYWDVNGLKALRSLCADGFLNDNTERNYRFGSMAKLVTDAAQSGSPLAKSVCDQGATALCVGIRLVATRFVQPPSQPDRLLLRRRLHVEPLGGKYRGWCLGKAAQRKLAACQWPTQQGVTGQRGGPARRQGPHHLWLPRLPLWRPGDPQSRRR